MRRRFYNQNLPIGYMPDINVANQDILSMNNFSHFIGWPQSTYDFVTLAPHWISMIYYYTCIYSITALDKHLFFRNLIKYHDYTV